MRKSRRHHYRHGGKRRSRHRRGGRQRVYSMVGCAARNKRGGGSSCGACGCPIAPFSWAQMNNNAAQLGGGCGCSAGNILPTFGGGQTGGGDTVDAGAPYTPCGVSNCNPIVGAGQYGGSFYKAPTPIPGPFVGSPWGASISKWPVADGISGDRNYYAGIGKVIDNDPALQMRMDDSGYGTANSQVGGYRYAADEDAVAVAEEASALSATASASLLPASSAMSSPASSSTTRRSKRRRRRRHSSASASHGRSRHRSRSSARLSLRRGGGLLPQELVNMGRAATFQVNSAYNTLAGVPAPVNPAPYQDQLVSRRPMVAELAAAAV